MIGRRFRLAHILFGRDIIEVATFRGHHGQDQENKTNEAVDGRILRDNVFGSIEEDAIRRDFTVNALYYDIADFSVLDFCNGMEDLDNRLLRMIGDPDTRYREDPVRMLRAIRLAVKLDLQIEENTEKPLLELSILLDDIPPARLWDESHKLFLTGYSNETFNLLNKYHLLSPILPQMSEAIVRGNNPRFIEFIGAALTNTDRRVNESKPLNPAFLYACFLWQSVLDKAAENRKNGLHAAVAMQKAQALVLEKQIENIAIPRRSTQVIREVWLMQHRLKYRRGKMLLSLLDHPRFRAAYDFMLLRTTIGEVDQLVADWWTKIQDVDAEQQKQMLSDITPMRRRKKHYRKKPSHYNNSNNS